MFYAIDNYNNKIINLVFSIRTKPAGFSTGKSSYISLICKIFRTLLPQLLQFFLMHLNYCACLYSTVQFTKTVKCMLVNEKKKTTKI